ncbi:MAG: hypothetical protein GXY82_01875 [Methanospirillum sp.]|nr:hypothetical protein [Methanospirillum sp.]
MPAPTLESVIDAMITIALVDDRVLGLEFTPDGVLIRLPTTRKIAERLDVPHYYVLPLIGMLEADGLVTRAERVGIRTTPAGTHRLFGRIEQHYAGDAESLLGTELFDLVRKRACQGLGP